MLSHCITDGRLIQVAFIKQEALEKAREIKVKADEEFAIEKVCHLLRISPVKQLCFCADGNHYDRRSWYIKNNTTSTGNTTRNGTELT